jgi:hypothetical protein
MIKFQPDALFVPSFRVSEGYVRADRPVACEKLPFDLCLHQRDNGTWAISDMKSGCQIVAGKLVATVLPDIKAGFPAHADSLRASLDEGRRIHASLDLKMKVPEYADKGAKTNVR